MRTGLANAVGDAQAGGLLPAANAAQRHRLAGYAGQGVQFVGVERLIGVGDPGHFVRAGAEIRRGDIDAGADEVLFDQFVGVAANDPLQFRGRIVFSIDADAALGPAERHVDHRALVTHQRRESHDLVLADIGAETDAALGGHFVVAMLGPPGMNDLDAAVVAPQGKRHVIDAVAGANLGQQRRIMHGKRRGLVEIVIHLIEETDFLRGHTVAPERWRVCHSLTYLFTRLTGEK